MEEKVFEAALAGLLHDVGKVAQRAGVKPNKDFSKEDVGKHGYHALLSQQFVENYVPKHLQRGLSGVLYHHQIEIHEEEIEIIRKADHLAAGERRTGSDECADPKEARLVPVLSNVSLLQSAPIGWKHRLAALDIHSGNVIYPTIDKEGDYASLWKAMTGEISVWKQKMDDDWEKQSAENYFITILAVLQKYLWCIPSATPWQENEKEKPNRAWPDVSLYDHARLTSAIAACLTYDKSKPDENTDEPIAFLVRGDFSGIQNFIYRISRPDAETEHMAKRLRGRSFYVQLLTEVVVDWLLREIGLPPVCAVFVGGGRFDLLLPLSSKNKLIELQNKLEDWFLQQFQGEIGILIAAEEAKPADFSDTREISRRLDENLKISKRHKWHHHLINENFFEPAGQQWHVCKVCQLTPMDESDICTNCNQQANIGKHLPYARYLAFCYQGDPNWNNEQIINFPSDSPFDVKVLIVREDDPLDKLLASKCRIVLYSINQTNNFIYPKVASSFRFLANSAPKVKERLNFPNVQPVEKGDVLHFEAIAALSKGANRLGVLKADVDRLGLIMSEGLNEDDVNKPPEQRLRPTLSRVASLSRMLDVFFAGILNQICEDIFIEWKQKSPNEYANKIEGLYYVMYSGGDDLFIVGPWDQILVLASHIQQKFLEFTGQNSNLTISAGYVQVKPRYPVQKFSELVDEAEQLAKKERNQIAVFGESLGWDEFKWLQYQANCWINAIDQKKLPEGLIYDLGSLFRQHREKNGKLRLMWTPRLYYTLARRLNKEVRNELEQDIFKVITSGKVLVPVSIASLSIRERSK